MNIPYSTDFSKAKAAVLGVPYDGGLHPTRIGSRSGPAAIREQSQLVRPFQPPFAKFNPLELLKVVDCGDADTTPSIIEDSFKEIEEAAHEIFAAEAAPLAFGGDGNMQCWFPYWSRKVSFITLGSWMCFTDIQKCMSSGRSFSFR
jgi:agmatinase